MAVGLENYDNIHPVDSDYPSGDIKDNTGAGDGTPFNREVYADIHQTFAKWLRLCGITPNTLPDNEYNGFQYHLALRKLFGRTGSIVYIDSIAQTTVVNGNFNNVVVYTPAAASGQILSLNITDDQDDKWKSVTCINHSASAITVSSAQAYPVNFATTASVAAGETKQFIFDGDVGPHWIG